MTVDKYETQKERKHHIKSHKTYYGIFCQSKAKWKLRYKSKYKKPFCIAFSGMGMKISFYQEIAHGNCCKITDICKCISNERRSVHKYIGYVIKKHGKYSDRFYLITAEFNICECYHLIILLILP